MYVLFIAINCPLDSMPDMWCLLSRVKLFAPVRLRTLLKMAKHAGTTCQTSHDHPLEIATSRWKRNSQGEAMHICHLNKDIRM